MLLRIKEEFKKRKWKKKGISIQILNSYRAAAIQNEVITSHKKNVEIDWNWQELEEKEDCEELAKVCFYFNSIYYFNN